MDKEFILKDETFKIIGACFNVYNSMGSGFLEKVYQECLEIEFYENNIPFKSECELKICYHGHDLNQTYIADFVCYDSIIVEIKSLESLAQFKEHSCSII
jgi:GxxExxY protein